MRVSLRMCGFGCWGRCYYAVGVCVGAFVNAHLRCVTVHGAIRTHACTPSYNARAHTHAHAEERRTCFGQYEEPKGPHTRAHIPTHTRTRAHTHTDTLARAHTHTRIDTLTRAHTHLQRSCGHTSGSTGSSRTWW